MDDRLVLRQGGSPAGFDGGVPHEPEENEDEKVYYGFGVFMGLPLADLKAMKEDLLQRQQALSGGAAPTSFGRSAGGAFGARDAPGVVPPVALANGRGHPLAPPHAAQHSLYGSSGRAPTRALGREYDASHGVDDDEENAGSDAGSDGSYSAPKSHSLNFILH